MKASTLAKYAIVLASLFPLHARAQSRPAGCPHAWCGCWLAMQKGLHDARLNLAANWARVFGHPTEPRPGAVVVWRHHVGELVAPVRGRIWIVRSGNDGHRVRVRPRSIAGAIAFRTDG